MRPTADETERTRTREEETGGSVSLVGVVDVDVLQQLGAEGRVGSLGAGQDLQHAAVVRAQEDHRAVLGRPRRRVHRYLGQLESAWSKRKKKKNKEREQQRR